MKFFIGIFCITLAPFDLDRLDSTG